MKCSLNDPWGDAWERGVNGASQKLCRHVAKITPRHAQIVGIVGYEARCRNCLPSCDRDERPQEHVIRVLLEYTGRIARIVKWSASFAPPAHRLDGEAELDFHLYPPIGNDRFWHRDIRFSRREADGRYLDAQVVVELVLAGSAKRSMSARMALTDGRRFEGGGRRGRALAGIDAGQDEHNQDGDMKPSERMVQCKHLLRTQYAMLYAHRTDLAAKKDAGERATIEVTLIEPLLKQIGSAEAELADLIAQVIDHTDTDHATRLLGEIDDALSATIDAASDQSVRPGLRASVSELAKRAASAKDRLKEKSDVGAKLKLVCNIIPGLLTLEMQAEGGFLSKAWGRVKSFIVPDEG